MDHQQLVIWFAGFYEGEGSISNDTSNRNRIRVCISQNDITPLLKGKEIWNGYIRKRVRKSPASNKICTGHEWVLNQVQALKFIDDIKDYMIIPYKIEQIRKCKEKLNDEWNLRFKCSFCDKDYADASGRRRHERDFHINKNELHSCPHCEKKYKTIDSMQRHIKLNHKEING